MTVYIVQRRDDWRYQGTHYWTPEFDRAHVYMEFELPAVIRALKYESDRYGPFDWDVLPYELTETPHASKS